MQRAILMAPAFVLALSAAAIAAQVLPGTYSSWTAAQKATAAQLLKQGSNVACERYITEAKQNVGQLAAYESAVCIGAYYVNHLPPDYPNLDEIKASVLTNYQSAKALGSTIPVPFVATPRP